MQPRSESIPCGLLGLFSDCLDGSVRNSVPCGIHFVKKLQKVKYRFCGDSSNIRTGPKVLLLMAAGPQIGPQFPAMLEIQSETQRVMTKFIQFMRLLTVAGANLCWSNGLKRLVELDVNSVPKTTSSKVAGETAAIAAINLRQRLLNWWIVARIRQNK